MTFDEAKRRYVHRFTMEHIPVWARKRRRDGSYYAPMYRSDREWFENTLFPPNTPYEKGCKDCYSTDPTWPLGKALEAPYRRESTK